jgi:hypothetical protein
MNNYDVLKGQGQKFQLFAEDVYSLIPQPDGSFYYGEKLLAKREKLPLTRDGNFKTMFVNEELRNAIKPLNEYTQFILFDEKDNIINNIQNLPSLNTEYSAIVFQVEPLIKPAFVSIVIYKGPAKESVLLKDGSVTMDSEYIPIKPTDVVTKAYADNLVEDLTSSIYPIKTFEVYQGGKDLIEGYSYTDNRKAKVIYLSDFYGKKIPNITVKVEPFAIPNNYSDDVLISLKVKDLFYFREKVADILKGKGKHWKCIDMENIYNTKVSELFWKNTLELTFEPEEISSQFDSSNPFFTLSVYISESGQSMCTEEKEYGLDNYISSSENTLQVIYKEADLEKNRKKFLSGNSYFIPDWEKKYELPFNINLKNNFLQYFRPETFCKVQMKLKDESVLDVEDLGYTFHLPLENEFTFDRILTYDLNIKSILVSIYNLSKEFLFSSEIPLNVETDESEELYRVKTVNSENLYPETGFGGEWHSEKPIEEWDPVLKNGVYRSAFENSAICFKIPNSECYSHCLIDIEHDGEMYLRVEGKTGWLSCNQLELFKNPVKNGEGCFVNNNFYSFGKVIYKTPLFIRILKASFIKFNSVILK